MDRRSVVTLGVGLIALLPAHARATSPDPIYLQPQTIVLHLRIVPTDKDYFKLIPREEMQARLVDYIHSELAVASLDVPVFDANTFHQPDGMPLEWILKIDCRVDLMTRATEEVTTQTVGVVSVVLRRYGGGGHLSGEPFTFFTAEKVASSLVPTVETAAKDAIKRSVLDYVIRFNK